VSSVTNMNQMFWGATSFTHKLCGAAWVHSKASKRNIFTGSSGSISRTVCTQQAHIHTAKVQATRRHTTLATRQYASQSAPNLERELITRSTTGIVISTINNAKMCPKCGTFGKSGGVSCCAPGGAWFWQRWR